MKVRELIAKLREASSGKNYDILVQDDIAGGDYYLGAKILDVDFNITDEGKLVMILKINSQDREEEYFEFENFDAYLEYKEENDDKDENMNADLETDSLTEDVLDSKKLVLAVDIEVGDYVQINATSEKVVDVKYFKNGDVAIVGEQFNVHTKRLQRARYHFGKNEQINKVDKAYYKADIERNINTQARKTDNANWEQEVRTVWSKLKESLTEDADLTGKIVKYKGITVKVLRKLTEQEKQKRAHLNNPDAGDYYEVETTSKEVGPSKFIVWEARLRDSLTEDVTEDSEDDFVFLSDMRHKDYFIEFFKNKQDGKYYWQAEYTGEDRKLGNFNIWITVRGISLYSEDDEGYPTKAAAVSKAKEWVNKQKRRWNEGIDKNMNPEQESFSDEEDDEDDYSNDYDFYVEYYEGTSPIPKFKEAFDTLEEAKQYATNNLIKNKKLEVREIYICTEGVNGPVQHDAWLKASDKWYSEYNFN